MTNRYNKSNYIQNKIQLLTFAVLVSAIRDAAAVCFFPPELQGEFMTQSTITHANEVIYTRINITEDSIPIWGECYKRINSNIILKIGLEDSSCFRCFHIDLVARNVLRVHTAENDYISRCYTNEEKAIDSCPTIDNLTDRNAHKEIILYKLFGYNGESIQRQYCPITGRYRFSYSADNGTGELIECGGKDSEIDSCPSGSALNLRFRHCTFPSYEMTLECLGHWTGYDGLNYMAFLKSGGSMDKFGPDYRCATYEENPKTGIITISFSSDSTCSIEPIDPILDQLDHMNASIKQNEQFILYSNDDLTWNHQHEYCNLPEWMHGEFEYLSITHEQLIFRDPVSFKTYTMKCLELFKDTKNRDQHEETTARVLTLSRTQCGEEQHQCVWIGKRSDNIVEFQIGSKTIHPKAFADQSTDSDLYDSIESLCDDQYFDKTHWTSQGRLDDGYKVSPCPIDGEFVGYIPDAEGLCAKMWSDCERSDIMYYQVSACEYGDIYDEREYQCVGQWTENNVIYTYTKRRDVPTYECFVGALYTDDEIFIKEAGEHCQRDVDPYRYGMQLNQTAACKKNKTTNHTTNDIISNKNAITSFHPALNTFSTTTTDSISIQNNDKNKSSTTVKSVMSAEATRPTNEIGYDFYDENHVNNITQTKEPLQKNHGISMDNGTVEIVNINKTDLNGGGGRRTNVDDDEPNNTIHSTIHRVTDYTSAHENDKSKYGRKNFSFSTSNSHTNDSIITIFASVALVLVKYLHMNQG